MEGGWVMVFDKLGWLPSHGPMYTPHLPPPPPPPPHWDKK